MGIYFFNFWSVFLLFKTNLQLLLLVTRMLKRCFAVKLNVCGFKKKKLYPTLHLHGDEKMTDFKQVDLNQSPTVITGTELFVTGHFHKNVTWQIHLFSSCAVGFKYLTKVFVFVTEREMMMTLRIRCPPPSVAQRKHLEPVPLW